MEKTKEKTRRNYKIDILRLFMALAIVYIHVAGSFEFSKYTNFIGAFAKATARIAVPLFFAISGYFFYRGTDEKTRENIKKQMKRTLVLAVMALALYMVFTYAINPAKASSLLKVKPIMNFVVFNRLGPIVYNGHLWYLFATLYIFIVYFFVLKSKKELNYINIALIGLVLYIASLLITTTRYSGIKFSDDVSFWVRNWLCMGLLFFTIGIIFRKYQDTIAKISIKQKWIFLIVASLLFIFEVLCAYHTTFAKTHEVPEFYFSLPLMVLAIMPLIITAPKKEANKLSNTLAFLGGNLSLYIYIIHIIIIYIGVRLLSGKWSLKYHFSNFWKLLIFYFVVSLVCIIASLAYYYAKKLIFDRKTKELDAELSERARKASALVLEEKKKVTKKKEKIS